MLERKLADSLRASMQRLRVERIDLLLLHSQLQPDDGPFAPRLLSVRPFREVVRPAFERLREEGVNRWMGLTDIGHPRARLEVLSDDSLPDAIQCVANALDLSGESSAVCLAARVQAADDPLEYRADIHRALVRLACCLVCWRHLGCR